MEKTEFEIIEEGTMYNLPTYEVVDGEGIKPTGEILHVRFVRGSKVPEQNGIRPKVNGVLHETLLSMMIHDLIFKNELVPSDDTEYTIQCLNEALESMSKRQKERESRGVEGTYSK